MTQDALTPKSPRGLLLHCDSGFRTRLSPSCLASCRCGSALSLPQSQIRTPGQTPWSPFLLPTPARASRPAGVSPPTGDSILCILCIFVWLLGDSDRKCFCPVLLCIKDHTGAPLRSKAEAALGALKSCGRQQPACLVLLCPDPLSSPQPLQIAASGHPCQPQQPVLQHQMLCARNIFQELSSHGFEW